MSEQVPGQTLPGPVRGVQTNATPSRGAQPQGALRVAGLVAVGVGLAALAGAAFVLSYAGIHTVAVQAGVSHRLARGYPLILDVLLVVILAAVLALRGAGWPSRLLAWASLLALLAAAAGADALHAAGRRLPTRPAAVTAAILPWALVLIAFVLLLAMLRHARLRRLAQAVAAERGAAPKPVKWQPQEPPPLSTQPLVPGFPARNGGSMATAPVASAAGTDTAALPGLGPNDTLRLVVPRQAAPESGNQAPGHPDLAIDAELAPDDPSTDEAELPADPEARDAVADPDAEAPDDAVPDDAGAADPDTATDKTAPDATSDPATADPEMPVFHRMWSSPVPPEGS